MQHAQINLCYDDHVEASPCWRPLVATVSPCWPGFNPRSVRMAFVVFRTVFDLDFPPKVSVLHRQDSSANAAISFIRHQRCVIIGIIIIIIIAYCNSVFTRWQ